MNDKDTIKKIQVGRFIKNNGLVLRTIHLLRYKYEKLEEVRYAIGDMSEGEYLDSLNYLCESEYIQLRHIKNKQPVELVDAEIEDIEAKLTNKGVKLLTGKIFDELVEV